MMPTHVTPAIECRGLGVVFERWGQRVEALRGIDLSIAVGTWVNIVGPNGSGKSTLFAVLAGRMPPTRGTALVEGTVSVQGTRNGGAVALIPQNPTSATVADLTIEEHFLVARRDLSSRAVASRAQAILAPYGLADRLRQDVATLSGGERQLLTLLLAAERGTRILLLDEPFAALDADRARDCLGVVQALWRERRTILLVTHDLGLARSSGNQTIGLDRGLIVPLAAAVTTPESLTAAMSDGSREFAT